MERIGKGPRSPISSRPIWRFRSTVRGQFNPEQGKTMGPVQMIATSQRFFRPHTVKKRSTVSPQRMKTPLHVVNLIGPQVQTSQWMLEKINTLILLRTQTPKTGKSDYIRRRIKTSHPKRPMPTKDQSSCTPSPVPRTRPKTTQGRGTVECLPRHKSEERLRPVAILFHNEGIRDWCGLKTEGNL